MNRTQAARAAFALRSRSIKSIGKPSPVETTRRKRLVLDTLATRRARLGKIAD